jgi:hypothetical protein
MSVPDTLLPNNFISEHLVIAAVVKTNTRFRKEDPAHKVR